MTDDSEDATDLTDLSDEEIQELSEELTQAMPEALGKAMGVDLFGNIQDEKREEFEEEFPEQIEEVFFEFRDALRAESDEEQAVAMFDVYNQVMEEFMMDDAAQQAFDSGLEWLVDQLEVTVVSSREFMVEIGHVEYFNLMHGFVVDIVEAGQAGDIKEFYDGIERDSQQMMLQRVFNPVTMEYYDYIEEHPEITSASEARRYIDMYYELAELIGSILPRFIAVLQIISGRKETYDDLKQMGLNNLLQKLESKKYSRFNVLADGIDRKLRNSIAHRDFTVDPVDEEIEFQDRGEVVAELSYMEFQTEFFNLLGLFHALWVFRMLLNYYRLQFLPEAVEELREETVDN